MKIEKIKTIFLIFLVGLSIFLANQLWFQPFRFSLPREENQLDLDDIYIWDKIKPEKLAILEEKEYTTYKADYCNQGWIEFLDLFGRMLEIDELNINEVKREDIDNVQGMKLYLPNPFPKEIFIKELNIKELEDNNDIKSIKSFFIPFEGESIYISTAKDRIYKINSEAQVGKESLIELSRVIKSNLDYSYNVIINNTKVNIPLPVKEKVENPVLVKSEINIQNQDYITNMAKEYFNESYDYVRKSVEKNNSINYVYKNEKVLKVNSDGLLEFYNTAESTINENDIYKSLLIALSFTENFLGFPENAYLSKIENIQEDGNFGYKFIFDYKILGRPIIFSQIRNERAIEVEVIGEQVILYKRFIRIIDHSDEGIVEEVSAINPEEIIKSNLEILSLIFIDENKTSLEDEEKIQEEIIKNIKEVYLGYYDPSRKLNEQLMRSAWVITINEERYIFNAITGSLVEIQTID